MFQIYVYISILILGISCIYLGYKKSSYIWLTVGEMTAIPSMVAIIIIVRELTK